MEKNSDPESGMNIPDLSFENLAIWVKILKFGTRIQDLINSGSGTEKFRSGINNKHPIPNKRYLKFYHYYCCPPLHLNIRIPVTFSRIFIWWL
jgi:hypothetical protein